MGISQPSDRVLWDAVLHGDGESFGVVFERHRDRVFRHALRAVDNHGDAEDVTAIAFLELWRRRAAARLVDDSILPWLLVTANYATRNLKRTRRRHARLLARLPHPLPEADVSESSDVRLDNAPQMAALERAIAALSRLDRDLLTLTALEGYTLHQASETLGITYGAAKTRMSRARGRLNGAVAPSRSGAPSASGIEGTTS
jgi:RNA polymerase sigma factor (sigma-70 family)